MQGTGGFKKIFLNHSEPGMRDGIYAVSVSLAIHIGIALILMTATVMATGLKRWEDPVVRVSLVSMPGVKELQTIPADAQKGYNRQREAISNRVKPAAVVSIDKPEQNKIKLEKALSDSGEAPPVEAATSAAVGVAGSEVSGKLNSALNLTELKEQGNAMSLPLTPVSLAAPRYRDHIRPAYPWVARMRGYEGVVLLSAEIEADGQVGTLKIKKSSGFSILDRSAIDAVKTWKFEPGRRRGMAVSMSVDVPVKFVLTGSSAAM
jgi:TonB family protein